MVGMGCKLWMVYGVLFFKFSPLVFNNNRILPSKLFKEGL